MIHGQKNIKLKHVAYFSLYCELCMSSWNNKYICKLATQHGYLTLKLRKKLHLAGILTTDLQSITIHIS